MNKSLILKEETCFYSRYPEGYFVQNLQFDFFNYAGLHRRVRILITPQNHVDDVTITTTIEGTRGKRTIIDLPIFRLLLELI